MTRLSRIVLVIRDLERGVRFYKEGLGLRVEAESQTFARLTGNEDEGAALELMSAESESQCTTGYSPFLTFEINDMDETVPRLIQHGGILDGGIRYESYGKLAALRSPDGHMVGLIEKANLPNEGDTALAAAKAAERKLASEEKAK